MQSHIKNKDTGTYNIHQAGEGFSDLFHKVASAVIGKIAQEIAKKALTKSIERSAEKIEEKTGQVVGEKIYDKFSSNKLAVQGKGCEIAVIMKLMNKKKKREESIIKTISFNS